MYSQYLFQAAVWLEVVVSVGARMTNDTLGLADGLSTYRTSNFLIELVDKSQTLASILPTAQPDFNFLPNTSFLALRAADGQYQLGDIILRYRDPGHLAWSTRDSAQSRERVVGISSEEPEILASADLSPTLGNLDSIGIQVLRTWATSDGDLTLTFCITNIHNGSIELGGLGFPMVSDSIFTNRAAVDIYENCSFIDPCIGLDGGYLQFTRVNGQSPAMVVTPLNGDSGLQAWGFLHEDTSRFDPLEYQTESFEGYYQYMPLTLAYTQEEWNASEPWNHPTTKILQPGESMTVGFRFTIVARIEDIETVVSDLGVPVARGIPGYILPEDLSGQLSLQTNISVTSIVTQPADVLQISSLAPNQWLLAPHPGHLGRTRVIVNYEDGRTHSINYYVTKSAPEAIHDLGQFLNDRHWWTNTSDPFGRAPSFMCVDHTDGVGSLVLEDYLARVWLSGESHEAGASWYTMALKQIAQPDAEQVSKLERFVDDVLWKTIQLPNYAVRQSIFWYDPNITDFVYNPNYPWWPETSTNYSVSWNKPTADVTTRSYGYTYPATTYWALYRVGRAFPHMLHRHSWEWYLTQAYKTLVYCFQEVNGTHLQPLWLDGLMGETAYGELLKDLFREEWSAQANEVESLMRARLAAWHATAVPYGSELGWDCTGEEGIFYWANYFNDTELADRTLQTIQGYMPSIAHWAYNGNARRYWDFQFDGKIDRIERQIHHYGSALNALSLLQSARASDAAGEHVLRLGYGGLFAPLANIHPDGFASAAFHSWPETLAWDNYTGDYGLAFSGLVLGSAVFVRDVDAGSFEVFGGLWNYTNVDERRYAVWPRDALRRRLYIESMRLFTELDAGALDSVQVDLCLQTVTLHISRIPTPGATPADKCVLWLNQSVYANSSGAMFDVVADGLYFERRGWAIPLVHNVTKVHIQLRK